MRPKAYILPLLAVFCLMAPVWSQLPPPEGEGATGDAFVNFNFDQVEIRFMVKLVGDITGRRFVVDQDVDGKVTVVTPSRIPISEVYPLFLAVMEAGGYAVVEQAGIYRVVTHERRPIPSAPVVAPGVTPEGGQLMTKVIHLTHVRAGELRRMLEPLVDGGKTGALAALETTNHLVVTDTADNIRRLETIIAQIDLPGAARMTELYSLQHALARDIAEELNHAISGVSARMETPGDRIRQRLARGDGSSVVFDDAVVVAAPHSNSLILAGTAAQIAELKQLIARMDVEPQVGRGNLQAIFLKYLSAEEAAKSMTALLARNAEPAHGHRISIEANLSNNALLVDAVPQDFEMVRKLIESLDLPSPQVLVEVTIAELTMGKGHDIGVEFLASGTPAQDSTMVIGGMRTRSGEDQLLSQVMSGVVPEGLTFGLAKGSYTDAEGNVVPRFPALVNLHAMKSDSSFKILSSVPLWTQNNQEASVTIGKNIPMLKSTIQGGAGTARDVIENIDRVDVGIKLKVTPQVNPHGEVLMRLNPSIEAIIETSSGGRAFTPTIARREVTTTLTVPSGETVVISGLIREDNVERERRVPILGSLPLLGWLFRHSVKEQERTNLLIFVTPNVVSGTQAARDMSDLWREKAGGPELPGYKPSVPADSSEQPEP